MKSFYVVFMKNNKAVCGTWVIDDDEDWAMVQAEFKLMCKYPNVEYDSTVITKREVA